MLAPTAPPARVGAQAAARDVGRPARNDRVARERHDGLVGVARDALARRLIHLIVNLAIPGAGLGKFFAWVQPSSVGICLGFRTRCSS